MGLFRAICVALLFGATLSAEQRQAVDENDVYVDDQASLIRSNSYSADEVSNDQQEEPVEYEPPNYNYAYAVQDDYAGNFQEAHEDRDGDRTQGSYKVLQPDGVTRTVVYRVEGDQGFNADVTFSPNGGQQYYEEDVRSARSVFPESQSGVQSSNLYEADAEQGPVQYVRVADNQEYETYQGQEDQPGATVVKYYRALPDDPRAMDFLPAFAPVNSDDVQYFTANDAVNKQVIASVPFADDYNEAAEDLNDPPADPVEDIFEQDPASEVTNQQPAGEKAQNGVRTRKVSNIRVQENDETEEPEQKFKILIGGDQETEGKKQQSPLGIKSVVPLPQQLFNLYRSRFPVVDFGNFDFGPLAAGPVAAVQAEKKRQQKENRKREDKEQLVVSSPKRKRQLQQQNFQQRPNHQGAPQLPKFPGFGPQGAFPGAGQFPGFPQFSQAQLRQIAQQQQQGSNGQQFPGGFPSPFFPGGLNFQPTSGKSKNINSVPKDDRKKAEEEKNSILQNLGLDEDDYEVQTVDSVKEALKALREQGGEGTVITIPAQDEPRNPEDLLKAFQQQQQQQQRQQKQQVRGKQQQQQPRRPQQQQQAFAALQAINEQSQQPFGAPGFPAGQQQPGGQRGNKQQAQFLTPFGIQGQFLEQQQSQFPGAQAQFQQQRPQDVLTQQEDPDFFGQGQQAFLPPQANLRNPTNFPAQLAAGAFRPDVAQQGQVEIQGFPGLTGFRPSPAGLVRNRRPGAPGASQNANRPLVGRPNGNNQQNKAVRNTNRPRPNRPVRNAQSEGGIFSNFPSLNFGGGIRGLFNRQPSEEQSAVRAQRSVANQQAQPAESDRPAIFGIPRPLLPLQGERPRIVRHLFRNRFRNESEKPHEPQDPVQSADESSVGNH